MEWGKKHIDYFDEWMAGMTQLLNQEGIIYKGEGMTGSWAYRLENLGVLLPSPATSSARQPMLKALVHISCTIPLHDFTFLRQV